MLYYQDYFPKSILHEFQIDPSKELIDEESIDNLKQDGSKEIEDKFKDIYATFNKKMNKNELKENNIQRRITSMFCDLDVISAHDINKYMNIDLDKELTLSQDQSRVSIDIPELNMKNDDITKSESSTFSKDVNLSRGK